MSSSRDFKPRLCHIIRAPKGYGFHLHGEKGKCGQSVRKVEEDSVAEHAGLLAGDRIIAVNGKNVESETHEQVVARIREKSGETELFVVDEIADKYFKENNISITEDLISNDVNMPDEREIQKTEIQGDSPESFRPRLCHLVKGTEGYGFNLHSEKGKTGRFIRSVDAVGAAADAGLLAGDRIIEVNGENIEAMKHSELVTAIKESGDEVTLLVVDETADNFFTSCRVTPAQQHVSGTLPIPVQGPIDASSMEKKPPPAPASTPANGDTPQNVADLLSMDLNMLKEKARAQRKQAPTSHWNNRQAMFNDL